MVLAYTSGQRLPDIAKRYRVTLSRIYQIVGARIRRTPQNPPDDAPILDIGLSLGVANRLWHNGYRTVRDVAAATDIALLRLERIGPESLREVRAAIPHRPK